MRGCSKSGCGEAAESTIVLRYEPREVVVRDLDQVRDPNLLELCGPHVSRLSPPIGWRIIDQRSRVPVGD